MSLKVFIVISLMNAVLAAPADPYKPLHEKKEAKPYAFAYGIQDEYAGTNFGQEEQSDGSIVQGTYTIQLSDGRQQIVNYKADHYNGFIADVSYKGEAKYPPKSKLPPFIVKPTHYGESPKYKAQPNIKEPAYPSHPPVYKPQH